jgi:hypothetical protein
LQLSASVNQIVGDVTFASSDLPDGLSVSASGLITGTPTAIGTGSSTVTVSYPGADSVQITVNWEVKEASEKPTIPTDGLVFYAPLSAASDTAETGQTLSVYGEVTYTESDGVKCADLAGGGYINFSDEGFSFSGAPYTIYFRAKGEVTDTQRCVVSYGTNAANQAVGVMFAPEGRIKVIGTNDGGNEYTSDANVVNQAVWNDIIVTYDGTKDTVYVNGASIGTFEYARNITSGAGYIGSIVGDGNFNFYGLVAEVRIYNRALTAEEISQLPKITTGE